MPNKNKPRKAPMPEQIGHAANPADDDDVRLIAFYLPQFHPIPENDAAWGEGFTEWSNVTRAAPLFAGHHQPQLPTETGFYDLRLPEVLAKQSELAKSYGIQGFCYYAYWFDGHRVLEKPLEAMLESGEPDMPFCLCWANENWTRRWDGSEDEVIIAQTFSPEYRLKIISDFLPYFQDPRYIRIDDKPVFIVYRPDIIPDLHHTLNAWREHARSAGVELYLVGCLTFGFTDPLRHGFDAGLEFPPHGVTVPAVTDSIEWLRPFHGTAYDYRDVVRYEINRPEQPFPIFRSAMAGWDNTARRGDNAHLFLDATPEAFGTWLSALVHRSRVIDPPNRRMVFVNAWNEWAEGAHLEPDNRFGRQWLQECAGALQRGGKIDEESEDEILDALQEEASQPDCKPVFVAAHQALTKARQQRRHSQASLRAFAGRIAGHLREEYANQLQVPFQAGPHKKINLKSRRKELIGAIDSPSDETVEIDRRTPFYASGWALDAVNGGSLPGTIMAILVPGKRDDPAYVAPLKRGLIRPDVAASVSQSLPDTMYAGYEIYLDLRDFEAGSWTLRIGAVAENGTTYLEPTRRIVLV